MSVAINGRAWNPRFAQYARAEGFADPAGVCALDNERYPGGCMCGFIVWMNERWGDWRALRGRGGHDVMSCEDYDDFDRWLPERVDELLAAR